MYQSIGDIPLKHHTCMRQPRRLVVLPLTSSRIITFRGTYHAIGILVQDVQCPWLGRLGSPVDTLLRSANHLDLGCFQVVATATLKHDLGNQWEEKVKSDTTDQVTGMSTSCTYLHDVHRVITLSTSWLGFLAEANVTPTV